MLKKWFAREIQQGNLRDTAELLKIVIESMERNTHSTWSVAHDDDLRTLKRAYVIIQNQIK